MVFSVDKAGLVALLVESILYGLYILLFQITIYVLVYKRSSPKIHVGMLLASIILFVMATIHLTLNFIPLLEAFHIAQVNPGDAILPFGDPRSFKNLFKISVLFVEIITGDIVLVYRCYVAWGGSIRVVIAPLVMVLATMISSSGIIYSVSKTKPRANTFQDHRLHAFIIATQVIVLVNNVLCTSLLAWKLWHMSRIMVSRVQRETLRSVALIIAQSGLVTATTWIIFAIVYGSQSPAECIVRDSLAPITGCTFCFIISRVALGLDNETNSSANSAVHIGGEGPLYPLEPVLDGTGRPHRPVEINVSSRQSVRVETEIDLLFKDKKLLEELAIL